MKFSEKLRGIQKIVSNSPKNYMYFILKLHEIFIRVVWNSVKIRQILKITSNSLKLIEIFLKTEWKWNFLKNWVKFSE